MQANRGTASGVLSCSGVFADVYVRLFVEWTCRETRLCGTAWWCPRSGDGSNEQTKNVIISDDLFPESKKCPGRRATG